DVPKHVTIAAGQAVAGARRIRTRHRGLQYSIERDARVGGEIRQRPRRDPVARAYRLGAQVHRRPAGVPQIELLHDFQVADERAQLGRGAELELAALDHVERRVKVVYLDADHVAGWSAFAHHDGVDDACRVAAVE